MKKLVAEKTKPGVTAAPALKRTAKRAKPGVQARDAAEPVFPLRKSHASLAAEARALELATHRLTARRQRDMLPGRVETKRLVLRAPIRGDVPDLVRIADNKAVAAMLSSLPSPYTRADAIGFVEISAQRADERPYAITLDGQLIGVTGFSFSKDGPPEVGYWLGEDHWGNGYATEAFRALLDAAFATGSFPLVRARALAENTRSRAVLTKSGFHQIDELRASFGNAERDIVVYEIGQPKWL